MRKTSLSFFVIFYAICFNNFVLAQYADLGSGNLKNQIWWFDWAGIQLQDGATKTFITSDGLNVKITFSKVTGQALFPDAMNTWNGAVLHFLYDFTNPALQPGIHALNPSSSYKSSFTLDIAATRNGIPAPFTFVGADAEGSSINEQTTFTTSGTNWQTIDFFKNSLQNSNPLIGCNSKAVTIHDTYGGSGGVGQNPVVATDAPATGVLKVDVLLNEGDLGGMAIALGVFAPVDRGDLPVSYGMAAHAITYARNNGCNYQAPFPSLTQSKELVMGAIAPDADAVDFVDDNIIGSADEDALSTFPIYAGNGSYSLTIPLVNTTGKNAYLAGWFDFNRNGTFGAGEAVTVTVLANAKSAVLSWTSLPVILPQGSQYDFAFRFRISSDQPSVAGPAGYAADGEVEDYLIPFPDPVITPSFTLPDTVCINTPVTIANKTVGATTTYWNFCVAGLNSAPTGTNLGNIGGTFSWPVFMDYGFDNGNYYGFVVNHIPGGLTRLDFGNSLLNTPTANYLGDFNGALPPTNGSEGIQIVQNEGKWYAIILAGNTTNGDPPRIIKIEFGTTLANQAPTATNWGNIGNLNQPIDLHVFREGNNWYGLTVNSENNTITRFNFTNSFNNIPTAISLGNLGNLSYPTGIYAINDNGFWRVFIVNGGNRFQDGLNSSLTRLDFGNSLLNNPTAVNLGNPGNQLQHPRDISILKSCGEIVAFVVNGKINGNEIIKLDFNNDLTKVPSALNLGNSGNLNFPHSISKLFRVNNDLFAFITNVSNNTITRLSFKGCSNAAIPNSNLKDPPTVTYTTAGTYNINLTIDDGLPTQASICKQVVVMPLPIIDFSYEQDECNPLKIKFSASVQGVTVKWDFGDGTSSNGLQNIEHIYSKAGAYKISLFYNGFCPATISKNLTINVLASNIIKNVDTTICEDDAVQLHADSAVSYCWSPSTYLNNASIANPIAKPLRNIVYYLTSKEVGGNLIKNGAFSAGNIDFTSAYKYAGNNTTEGEYFVGLNPQSWNGGLSQCFDHTNGAGNMLLVNGSPIADVTIWSQTITVTSNTNYEFSTWIQSLFPVNPAKLQFSINGNVLGENITASQSTCEWTRFNTNWNSGANTAAVISIVNKNTALQGNDFALDDISFAPLTYKKDSVSITIDKPVVKANNDTSLCANTSLQLKAVGATRYSWLPAIGLSNNVISNPVAVIKDTAMRYIVSGTNTNGCSAKDTVVISILPGPSIGISNDTSICGSGKVQLQSSGGINYQWTPVVGLDNANINNPIAAPSSTTQYHLKVTGSNGCTTIDSVTVNVLPVFTINISKDTAVCANSNVHLQASGGVSYQWLPSTSLSNAVIANPVATPLSNTKYKVVATNASKCTATDSVTISTLALPVITVSNDTSVCKLGTASLKAAGGVSYNWTPASGLNDISSATPIASPANSTTYKVEVTGANTCKAVDSIHINILPAPVIQVSKDAAICGVGSVPLNASGGLSYLWTPSNGLSNNLSSTPTASPTTTTLYQVLVTGINTCTSTASVTVTVLPAMITSISRDTSVCGIKSVQLSASGGNIYQWTPSTGLNNSTMANPVASPLVNTTYSVKITNTDNCSETKSVTVTVLALPVISMSNDTVICRPGNVQLQASGGVAYQWTPKLGLSNSAISNPVAAVANSMGYKVFITGANNCTNTDSVSIGLRPPPQFGITTSAPSGCANVGIQLGAYGGDKYQWSPATGLSNASISNPVATLQNSQVYTVMVKESVCNEQVSFIIPVTIKTLPPVFVTKFNDISCNTPTTQLSTTSLGTAYTWAPSSGLSSTSVSNPVASPTVNTIYTVSVLDAGGCKSSGAVEVKVLNNNDFRLYQMPNAFTPGNDSQNDCFGVSKWGSVNIIYFEVYNRWGQLIFKGNNSRPCWDGRLNGIGQPSNNYVYRLRVETLCGVVERKGSVVLIR